jgi:putative tryptophan/tyrosine transport system substrate-binding protein
MQRRDFIALLGGVFSWPFLAHAQQKAMPVLGWLSPATAQSYQLMAPDSPGPAQLRAALAKYGLVDGSNIRVELRLAEGKIERLPELAKELDHMSA